MHPVQRMWFRLHGRVESGRIFHRLLTGQSARQRKGKTAKLQDKWGARKSLIESDMCCVPSCCTADTTGTFCSKTAWSCADLKGCCFPTRSEGKWYELWDGQQPDWHRLTAIVVRLFLQTLTPPARRLQVGALGHLLQRCARGRLKLKLPTMATMLRMKVIMAVRCFAVSTKVVHASLLEFAFHGQKSVGMRATAKQLLMTSALRYSWKRPSCS